MGGTGPHGTNILPEWLAIAWTIVFVVFVVILVLHARHLVASRGQTRLWHAGHILMALGMAVMYAPASINPVSLPAGFWQLVFATTATMILMWALGRMLARRPTNLLWPLMTVDMAAMVYMWDQTSFVATITWLLVAYLGSGHCWCRKPV